MFRIMMYAIILSISTCSVVSFAKEFVSIKFNDKLFSRPYPKTYDESIIVIDGLEVIVNKFALSVDNMNITYMDAYAIVNSSMDSITVYTDSIKRMTSIIDSLNNVIRDKNKDLLSTTTISIDKIEEKINNIKTKPSINFGVGVGYSTAVDKNATFNEVMIMPVLMINRFYIGGLVGNDPRINLVDTKLGCYVGMMFK